MSRRFARVFEAGEILFWGNFTISVVRKPNWQAPAFRIAAIIYRNLTNRVIELGEEVCGFNGSGFQDQEEIGGSRIGSRGRPGRSGIKSQTYLAAPQMNKKFNPNGQRWLGVSSKRIIDPLGFSCADSETDLGHAGY